MAPSATTSTSSPSTSSLPPSSAPRAAGRRDPPRPPLLRLGDEVGVHSHEAAPDAHEAALCLGQEVDLFRAERLPADGELVVEIEQRPKVEAGFGHRRGRWRHDRPQAQPAGEELTWPEHGDAGALQAAGSVEQSGRRAGHRRAATRPGSAGRGGQRPAPMPGRHAAAPGADRARPRLPKRSSSAAGIANKSAASTTRLGSAVLEI